MTAPPLVHCAACRTWHIPLDTPCPPVWACPDCYAGPGYPCRKTCPRHVEVPDD